jgi:hypothetical protein
LRSSPLKAAGDEPAYDELVDAPMPALKHAKPETNH